MTAAEFVFRHAGGCLIDTPDLEPARPGDTEHWTWNATIWQDRHRPDGWNALEWAPAERGWVLPATTSIGDVVEFGAGAVDPYGNTRFDRWWGWIRRVSYRALIVIGPFEHPLFAEHDARATVDELRLSQLDAPDIVDAVTAALGTDRLD